MKKTLITLFLFVGLILSLYYAIQKIITLQELLDNSINNEKAYAAQNSTLREKNLSFKLTIDQLTYYQDSLMLQMKHIANENGIKDKHIRNLQHQLEIYKKIDTIVVKDTIFIDPKFVLDTCIVDKWNQTCLHLQYPGIIGVSNVYKNDKFIILNSKREPVKPRKWFLPKLFTRKHTILEITVVDENPYVETKEQTYIEIID